MNSIPSHIMDRAHAQTFIDFFKIVQSICHRIAVDHGWWGSAEADTLEAIAENHDIVGMNKTMLTMIAKRIRERNDGELIALMHSELSEAFEGYRHHNPASDHIPEFSSMEEEMADTIIRIMDFSERRGLRTAEALIAKMHYNHGREHRHGGKAC